LLVSTVGGATLTRRDWIHVSVKIVGLVLDLFAPIFLLKSGDKVTYYDTSVSHVIHIQSCKET